MPIYIVPRSRFEFKSDVFVMEKSTGNSCPKCGTRSLNIYYEDGCDIQLGAMCEACGLKGFFMSNSLVPVALA